MNNTCTIRNGTSKDLTRMLQVHIGIKDGLTPAMTVGVQVFEKVKPRRRDNTVVVFVRTLVVTLVTISAPPPPRMTETVVERRLRQIRFVVIIRGMTEVCTDLAHTVP